MKKSLYKILLVLIIFSTVAFGQKPYRVGTTAANFLELGFGSAGISMGDAYVSVAHDLSSIYWNPAGLGYMEKSEFMMMYQPWFAGINNSFVGYGYAHPILGTFALGIYYMSYGSEEVTNVLMQEGTGEKFDGYDFAVNFSFGRRLAEWFSFGATGKYIGSKIWHCSGSALAFDLGAIVNTKFLSKTGKPGDGLNIGTSISNYGSKLSYNGIDLKQTVDIAPDEEGNYKYVPVRYELASWELPLIFRIGISFTPLLLDKQRLIVSIDALHLNNNSEYVNMGAEYKMKYDGVGDFSLRLGYRSAFMSDSEFGLTYGFGIKLYYLHNRTINIDYAYRDIGILGNTHAFTFGISF